VELNDFGGGGKNLSGKKKSSLSGQRGENHYEKKTGTQKRLNNEEARVRVSLALMSRKERA